MKNNTTKILILSIVLAVLLVGLYVYSTQYISGLVKKTAEIKEEIGKSQAVYKNAETIERSSRNIEIQKIKIASYFVPAGGAINFIADLERVAADFGLEYTTQNISEENTEELDHQGKGFLRVTFSASGSWKNIMRLLRFVESLPYGLSIDKVDLNTDKGVPGVEDASGNVSARKWSATMTFSVLKTKDNAK